MAVPARRLQYREKGACWAMKSSSPMRFLVFGGQKKKKNPIPWWNIIISSTGSNSLLKPDGETPEQVPHDFVCINNKKTIHRVISRGPFTMGVPRPAMTSKDLRYFSGHDRVYVYPAPIGMIMQVCPASKRHLGHDYTGIPSSGLMNVWALVWRVYLDPNIPIHGYNIENFGTIHREDSDKTPGKLIGEDHLAL